jgi:histidinol dehydrogenase
MRIIRTKEKRFKAVLKEIATRGETDSTLVEQTVKDIIADVRARGDKALAEYTLSFDKVDIKGKIKVSEKEIKAALRKIPKKDLEILKFAKDRIESFHKKQLQKSWLETEENGTVLGQRVTPIEKVGIYVPGGKAAYPSTVLMNAVPAKVAGVKRLVMVTPPNKKGIDPYVLAAASIAGVDAVYRLGGAQAIAALAYGTKSVPKIDKITGPGNIYVATAKRLVFGTVDIDMIAGPSEILVLADRFADPRLIAADLLGQAEHDELASSILVTPSCTLASKVKKEVALQIKKLKRHHIAKESIKRYGVVFKTNTMAEAIKITNELAPEHLELMVKEPMDFLKKIKNAGAIFLGSDTPEALGDYIAGPNHTLPTGGTARFSSPLGTEDFQKKSSVIDVSAKGLKELGSRAARFAEIEGLGAHALSVKMRLKKS